MKILDLINALLNVYVKEGNVPIFYEGEKLTEAWPVEGVEVRDSVSLPDTQEDGVTVIY